MIESRLIILFSFLFVGCTASSQQVPSLPINAFLLPKTIDWTCVHEVESCAATVNVLLFTEQNRYLQIHGVLLRSSRGEQAGFSEGDGGVIFSGNVQVNEDGYALKGSYQSCWHCHPQWHRDLYKDEPMQGQLVIEQSGDRHQYWYNGVSYVLDGEDGGTIAPSQVDWVKGL